jgi:hypothetical protein
MQVSVGASSFQIDENATVCRFYCSFRIEREGRGVKKLFYFCVDSSLLAAVLYGSLRSYFVL